MTQLPFTFSNALMHLTRTGGPKGFIWKFALSYGVGVLLLYALMMWSFAPIFSIALDPSGVNEEAMDAAVLGNMGRILSGYLIAMVGGLVLWIVFEAASQRRYMRADGFSLRLGADEGRLFVVGLIFFGIFIASYVVMLILMAVFVGGAVLAAGEDNAGIASLLIFPVMILYFVGLLFVMVRFSPAASLTIRDRAIRFSSAWRVSRGKGWAIFGSWLLLYIAMYAVLIIAYLMLAAVAFAALIPVLADAPSDDPEVMMQVLSSPVTLAGAAIGGFVITSIMGVFIHAFGGPAALAAKTDPEWADQTSITETFG